MTAPAARIRGGVSDSRPAGAALAFWLPAAMAAGYAAWFWSNPIGGGAWSPFGDGPMHGESESYLRPNSRRATGYPLFLHSAIFVFGSVEAVPRVQLALAAASAWFLGWSAGRAARAPWLAPALAGALFAAFAAVRLHAYILSEALFLPLSCAALGLLALNAARPAARTACAAALACGLAIMTRPAGLGLLAAWPALLWFVWGRLAGRRLRFAAAAALPLALCALAEGAAWRAFHPDIAERPNIANRQMFAKALLTEEEPAAALDAELAGFLADARSLAAPLRAVVAGAPDWRTRTFLLERAQHGLLYPFWPSEFRPRLEAAAERRGTTPHRLVGVVARAALLGAPLGWMANAGLHYRALWSNYAIYDADAARRRADGLARFDDVPILRDSPMPGRPRDAAPGPVAALNAAGTWASFLLSLAAIGAAAWRRARAGAGGVDGALALAALSALAVHGYFATTALLHFVQLRYSAAMWPIQAVYCVLLAAWALRAMLRRAGSERSGRGAAA